MGGESLLWLLGGLLIRDLGAPPVISGVDAVQQYCGNVIDLCHTRCRVGKDLEGWLARGG